MTNSTKDALAELLRQLRPDWDLPGVLANLSKAHMLGEDVGTICHAAIDCALNQANRTPAVLAMDGPHYRRFRPANRTASTSPIPSGCSDHPSASLRADGECGGCYGDRSGVPDGVEARPPAAHAAPVNLRGRVQSYWPTPRGEVA